MSGISGVHSVSGSSSVSVGEADLERRFGGLRRLYGDAGYARLRAARLAVVGLGGVGSWAAEALARCGVAELVLVDFDHVAESNIHRQVQATSLTLGQAKAQALAERFALIHPGCKVHAVEEFATPENWPALLPVAVDGVIDACDQVRAKEALARWVLEEEAQPGGRGTAAVFVGAAGGKRLPHAVQLADLAEVTHDPLLAALRQRLRRAGVMPPAAGSGRAAGKVAPSGLRCVFSHEPVAAPQVLAQTQTLAKTQTHAADQACAAPATAEAAPTDGSLNCHGYGSSVMVTAAFGMAAAGAVLAQLLAGPAARDSATRSG